MRLGRRDPPDDPPRRERARQHPNFDIKDFCVWLLLGSLSALVVGWIAIDQTPDYDPFLLVGTLFGVAIGIAASAMWFWPGRMSTPQWFIWRMTPIPFIFVGAGLGWLVEVIWRAAFR
jgi:hypothetical protein